MKKIITALVIFAACGTSAFAAEMKTEVSAGLGSAMAKGDWGDSAGGGIGVDLAYEGCKIDDIFTVGAGLFYTRAAAQDIPGFDYSAVSYSALGLTPYIKAEKKVGGQTLYGVFGFGPYNIRNTAGDIKSGGSVTGSVVSASAYYIGANLGGGVMYQLNDKMKIGGELKYHFIFASGVNPKYLVPAVRFAYAFGGEKVTRPPAAAPVVAAVRPETNAVIPADSIKKCPGTSFGDAVLTGGCAPDSDADGVPDSIDKCPGTSTGTAVDAIGCPLDTDADGVPDSFDKCPGTPAAIAVDAAGCPAGSPAEVQALNRLLLLAAPGSATPAVVAAVRGAAGDPACPWDQTDKMCMKLAMEFDYDKAELKGDFAAQLREIVVFMSANPGARIELQGYTDEHGSDDYNLKLSEARANAVMKHLIETDGLDAGRLSVKGFGKALPVASNLTEESRQGNRRVIAVLSMKNTR